MRSGRQGRGGEAHAHRFVPVPLTPQRPQCLHTSAMIFSSSRFSFSSSRDFSSSLLFVDEPVFMVSCASDCHSPRVISLRIWGPRTAHEMGGARPAGGEASGAPPKGRSRRGSQEAGLDCGDRSGDRLTLGTKSTTRVM